MPMVRDDSQFGQVLGMVHGIKERSPFYADKFEDIDTSSIMTKEDFENLPFTEKADLRNAYPLGLAAVPEERIVRIHSSSGTTGTPVVIPYTQKDVDDWADMFVRCYRMAGIDENDRIQITPGYGLWTAGIGFQNGCERLGAMAVPMGPGNTEKQLRMMQDMGSTVICSTSSYALLLAEEVRKRDIRGKIKLHTGIIGSEFWGIKTRETICENLGIDVYDIYGLTEIYGPGIGIDCKYHNGIHLWDDYIYCEIIDPVTGEVLPEGEKGELVITTFRKDGAPLVRYRTHDLTRFIPGKCPCGCDCTRIDRVSGRTDDMFKVKAVNMFPAQFEEVISSTDGTTGEFLIVISTVSGRDSIELFVETEIPEDRRDDLVRSLTDSVRSRIGVSVDVAAVDVGSLPRSEKKTARVIDRRD